MPLIRIDVIHGRSEGELRAIGNAVHRALGECLGVPERDRFQVITEHSRARLIYDPAYLGVERTDAIVFVQVILSKGRSTEQKCAFYSRAVQLIAMDAQVRPEDVTIVLIENRREDWSFGNGIAQYLTLPKEQWK
jgi:4-oxalocrotonate tautomerase